MVEFQPGIKILHQAGKVNVPADLLSRRTDLLASINLHQPEFMEKLKIAQEKAPELLIYQDYAQTQYADFRYRQGWLYTKKDQLILPTSRLDLMYEKFHNSFGHMGVQCTLARADKQF